MSTKWWEKPYRIVQTNLREIDARLDPREVVRSVKEFPANVLLFNVGGIVAFYPTDLEYHYRNRFLESDLLREVVDEAHRQGIYVVGRFDFSKATKKVYMDHPDWFWHTPEGKPVIYNGLYHTCINGGWYRHYAMEILNEALGRYELDGLFFNMFGYQVRDYSGNYWGVCHCPGCKRLFNEAYGMHLPLTEDWRDPAFRNYVQFRKDTSQNVARMIYEHIKKIRPDIGVMLRFDTSDLMRGEVNRAVDRELPEWGHWSGEQARWMAAFGRGKPYSSTLVHFIDIPYRFSADGEGCQGLRLAQQLANGAQPDYYVLGTLDQEDTKPYAKVRELFSHHEKDSTYYTGCASCARIGLYYSETTRMFKGDGKSRYDWHFRGMYKALVEEHLPFDLVLDHRVVSDGDALTQLQRYSVIVIPNAANLSDRECKLLDEYVRSGGRLLATYETGMYDERGLLREQFPLKSLGVTRVEWVENDVRSAYIRIDESQFPGFEKTRLVILDEGYVYVEAQEEAKPRFRLVPPSRYGPPELCYPLETSGRPGAIEYVFGDGKAIFLPWPVDKLYYRHGLEDHRKLIANLITELSPEARILETNAPPQVEITVYRQETNYQLRLVNYTGHQQTAYHPPVAVHGITVSFNLPDKPKEVKALVTGSEVPYEYADGQLSLSLPPLEYYELVVASW